MQPRSDPSRLTNASGEREPDPDISGLNEQIANLKIELITVEDWHSHSNSVWQARDTAIRAEIHELERLRDLLPEQRNG